MACLILDAQVSQPFLNVKDIVMNKTPPSSRRREWQTFLLLTVVLIPLLSVITVAGYGFIVWFIQIIFGPPGHG